jgi:hypothetical protein
VGCVCVHTSAQRVSTFAAPPPQDTNIYPERTGRDNTTTGVGPSLDDLAHSCGPPYANATYDPDLAHFRNHEWIEAPVVVKPETDSK